MINFIKNHKFGISLLAALLAGVIIVYFSGGCPIYRIFGVECLSCGMTHAVLNALKLNFKYAFRYHPMFWSTPIIGAYILFEGKPFKKKSVNIAVLIIIISGFIVQYILKYEGIIKYPGL
ncbi:MAG: DUF2752 domain-containing protein [Clostridia bacterium]|nr:DUF2752 domain-containing protein [Clostridia bacterium]